MKNTQTIETAEEKQAFLQKMLKQAEKPENQKEVPELDPETQAKITEFFRKKLGL